MNTISVKNILTNSAINNNHLVAGWVRNKRGSKSVGFIMLNDGSCIHDLQIIIEITPELENVFKQINTGASISVFGKLKVMGDLDMILYLCQMDV